METQPTTYSPPTFLFDAISLQSPADVAGDSTKFTMFADLYSSPTEARREMQPQPVTREVSQVDTSKREMASKIARMKHYSPGEELEEKLKGVTTKLELYSDPWNIKKKLTSSDLGHSSRLLLKRSLIETHVLPFMIVDEVNEIVGEKGLGVDVWDSNTDTMHRLVFKKWPSSSSYVFIGKWPQDFVKRRNLQEGDEILMYWDAYYSRFNFRVLQKAGSSNSTCG